MATRRITGTSPVPMRPPNKPSLSQSQSHDGHRDGHGKHDGHSEPPDPSTLLHIALGTDISVNIPEGAKLSDIESTLSIVISGYKRLSDATERLKPVIGRIILTVANRRLYRPEYRNLTEYIEKKVVADMGLSRTNAFESLRIAKAFPSMSLDDYQKYGASRLLVAATYTDETDPGAKDLLDASTRETVDDFAERVKDMKQSSAEPPKTFVVSVRLPLDWKDQWEELLKSSNLSPVDLFMELIRSYVETHAEEVEPEVSGVKG